MTEERWGPLGTTYSASRLIQGGPVGDEDAGVDLPGLDGLDHVFKIPAGGVAAAHQRGLALVKLGVREADIALLQAHQHVAPAVRQVIKALVDSA